MRYLNDEFKPFFVLLQTCFVYGIQGGNQIKLSGRSYSGWGNCQFKFDKSR